MRRLLVPGLTALGLFVLFSVQLDHGAEAAKTAQLTPSFTISSDPAQPVVSVTFRGGLTDDRGRYVLHGNGRFLHDSHTRSGDLLASFETTLPYDEMREIVAIAVNSGLMDTDAAQLDARVEALKQTDPLRAQIIINDSGASVFTISLTSYTRDGVDTGPVSKSYRVSAAKLLVKFFPEVPELAGLAELSQRLNEIAIRAEEGQEQGGSR